MGKNSKGSNSHNDRTIIFERNRKLKEPTNLIYVIPATFTQNNIATIS
jgi:hypothetical protein